MTKRGRRDQEVMTSTMNTNSGRVFGCKTCNRQFPTFQALGGHRASHKKAKVSEDDDRKKIGKPKVHECSICGVEFAIGQALGGHMRRHRAHEGFGHGFVEKKSSSNGKRVLLDLNLPPLDLEDDDGGDGEGRKLGLALWSWDM